MVVHWPNGIKSEGETRLQFHHVRKAVDSHSKDTLSFLLFKEQVRDVTPDEGEVERFYQEIVKEWKITSVMFEKEDAAKQFKQTLEGDKDFDEAAKEAMGEGLAKEVDWGNYLKNRELTRPIARLVSCLSTTRPWTS